MWNRALGLSNEKRETSSPSSGRRKNDDEKRPERKRTTSTRKSSGTEEKDRRIDTESMTPSSSSRAPYSEGAAASVASSYATAPSNNPDQTILPPQLVGNANLPSEMLKSQSGREETSRDNDLEREKARKRDRSTSRNRKEGRQNRSRSRDREERRRERKERREKRQDRHGPKESGSKKSESDYQRTSRAGEAMNGSGGFSAQVGASGFTQFPGQFDGSVPGFPGGPTHLPHISDHVPDQFPGQFPTGSSAPYRPPLSVEQGGPGLAADYYGDAGESVATQPGVRPQAPTLIVGAQPHLMAASPVEAPPIEPSLTGGVGAAASFFSGATFESQSATPKHDQPSGRPTSVLPGAPPQPPYSSQPSSFALPSASIGAAALGYIASTHGETPHGHVQGSAGSFPPQVSTMPPPTTYPTTSMPSNNNNHSSSEPIIPTLGSAAIGAAAGYMMGSHPSQQQPINPTLPSQGPANYRPSNAQHPPQPMYHQQGSYPVYDPLPQPGKQSPSSSNLPLYAAGALGAAGLAAAAYHHEHQDTAQNSYTGQSQPSAFMPQPHRHRGPLSKLVDFFRDPEGVAQFEEYSEYIGVCRYCFAPGSSPRDAPRKHYYRRKRSNERLGASIRVDKESRYSSSDGESRRKNKNSSWIASGIAGIGLANVGKSLFASNHDFDDTYSVRSGRLNHSTASIDGRRYNSSPNQKSSISHGIVTEPSNVHSTYNQKRRSTYKEHETGIGEAALVAAMGAASMAESSSRKRSRSPRGTFVESKTRNTERDYTHLPEQIRRDRTSHPPRSAYIEVTARGDYNEKGRDIRKKKEKKKNAGFFNFANSSSSDTNHVAHTGSDRSKAKKSSRTKIKDHNDANAALMGLGAATAALAAAEGRKGDKRKRRSDVVAVKEVKVKDSRRSDERRTDPQQPIYSNMEEAQWESAPEDIGYSSADSALAYGVSRRSSNDSLHSNSSGTEKWGWRWGSGSSKRKEKLKREKHSTDTIVGVAAGLAGAVAEAPVHANEDPRLAARSSDSSLPPLQYVYPIATSDPSHYDVMRHDSATSGNQPVRTSRPAAIPLQQPQPIMPVSSVIYATQAPYDHSYSAPAGPPVFSQPPLTSSFVPGYGLYNGYVDFRQGFAPLQHPPEQTVMATASQAIASERELQRQESSPAPEIIYIEPKQPKRPSTHDDMSAVRFALTEEQKNKEFRDRERHREHEREGKNSDLSMRDDYVNNDISTNSKPRRSRKGSRSTGNSRRDEQIDSVVNSFKESESSPTMQKNGNAWVVPTLVGVAAAAIGAAATEHSSGRGDLRDARRKAEPVEYEDPIVAEDNQERLSDREDEGQVSHDERQKALARKAAALVKRTPSPAHQDYSSFFAPTEFLSKSKTNTMVDDSNGGNDITSHPVPEIVTNEPFDQRGFSTSVPYTFLGADNEVYIDPNFMRLPWQVPKLNLIKPTPPASMAGSVRGDASPILRPETVHASEDEEHQQSGEDPKRTKVTFGESETHEYEVVTPEDHCEEFIRDYSDDRTTEQEKPIDHVVPATLTQGTESPVEEITRDHVPGEFGDDLDFAATLAAGLQGSGFDPSIVIDNPTYRRRDSPPGSEDMDFRRKPFFEAAEDLSLITPGPEIAPPQHGFVEGELPLTPQDELLTEFIRPTEDGRHNSEVLLTEAKTDVVPNGDMKLSRKEDEFREAGHHSEVPHIIEVVPRTALDKKTESPVDQRPHTNEPSPNFTDDKDEFQDASEFASIDHGSSTMPDTRSEAGDALEAQADSVSTKKRSKKSKGRAKLQDQDIYDTPDDDTISNAVTAPVPVEYGDQKRSKKKSKRKTSEYNDATSVVSSPAAFETEKDINDELGNGISAPIPSAMDTMNKSTDQRMERESGKPREATSDDFEDPKKKSKKSKGGKHKADEDWFKVDVSEGISESSRVEEEGSQSQASSSKREKRKKNGRRNGIEDSGMVTQGIPAEDGKLDEENDKISLQSLDDPDPDRGISRSNQLDQPLSFLGMRRELTEPPDITNTHDYGSTVRRISSEETFRDAIRSKIIEEGLPPLPASRPTSPTVVGSTGDLPSLPPSRTTSPVATPGGQRRRHSVLQLAESSHQGSSPSPTAVPLMFRRFPSSTGVSRSNPSSPGQSPRTVVPFSPRQRQGRPLSTEFKSSTEFRPLWLVERHNPSRRGQGPEVAEESYPSLPSSHSTSRASSVHDPRIEDSDETHRNDASDKDITEPEESPFAFGHKSDHTDDFLDSQQPTPTRDSFFNELETGSVDPVQQLPKLPSQSVNFTPHEDSLNLDLLEHKGYFPGNLPSLPRSRESSPYGETSRGDDFSTAKGVAIGAMATGALATLLDSTSRSDKVHELNESSVEKLEPENSFHVSRAENSRSEPDSLVPSDTFEAFATTKEKKKKDKKQRKVATIATADRKNPDDVQLFETTRVDTGLHDAQVENDRLERNEANTTLFSSTPSKKSKKDKGKSKSLTIDAPGVDDSQSERTARVDSQAQRHETGSNDGEVQPKLDKELLMLSESAVGSVAVAATVAAVATEAILNPESSDIPAVPILPLESNDWPNFSAKSKKGKKQKGKKTLEHFEEQLLVSASSVQEVKDLDFGTRDSEEVKEADVVDIPSSKRSKKAKKNRKSDLNRGSEENLTTETDQGMAVVAPKDIEMHTNLAEMPEIMDRGTMPDDGLGSVEPIHTGKLIPETIALPADDDLDLLPALPPDSPLSELKVPKVVNRELLLENETGDGKLDTVKPGHAELLSPKAVALPADDDLDLLPALPSDSPLSEPQIVSVFVTEKRDLLDERTSMEDIARMTSAYGPTTVGKTHLSSDLTESPMPDVERSSTGDRGAFVESSDAQEASAEGSHEQFSFQEPAVEVDEPPMMRAPVLENSGHEQKVDLERNHLSKGAVEEQEPDGSGSRTSQMELTKHQLVEKTRDTSDVVIPSTNNITDSLQTTIGEAPSPYEQTSSTSYHTPAQDPEIAASYPDDVLDENEELSFPSFKKGKKSKKGQKDQLVKPLEEPALAERSIADSSVEASASIPEVFSGNNPKETAYVPVESATDERAISTKKQRKKGRKNQPATPFEELSSTDRGFEELLDETSASLDDKVLPNVYQKASATTDEQATDKWATSFKNNGKKAKKSQTITPSEDLSPTERTLMGTPDEYPILAQESIFNADSEETDTKDALAIDEWAITSKQKGKKSKSKSKSKSKNGSSKKADLNRDDQNNVKDIVDVRDLENVNQRILETSSEPATKRTDSEDQGKPAEHHEDYPIFAAELSLATTDTAKQVSYMLSSAKDPDSRDILRGSPDSEAQTASNAIGQEHESSDVENGSEESKNTTTSIAGSRATTDLAEHEKREKSHQIATTDTAAEVRNMLASTDDLEVIAPTQKEDQLSDTEFQGFATKKKGKKSKKTATSRLPDPMPPSDIAPTTIPFINDASVEGITREAESIDTFSIPKTKKDKKSKRKAIARSASDYQDTAESTGLVNDSAVTPKSVSDIPVARLDQDSLIDEAASVELPSQKADELVEDGILGKESILLPSEAAVHCSGTPSIEEVSNIALPTEETEDLQEREENSGESHLLEPDPDYKEQKSESKGFSESSPTKGSDTDILMEAVRLSLPEDLQNDFIESSKLNGESVSPVKEYLPYVTESSGTVRTQPDAKDPMQPLDRGINVASSISDIQSPVALRTEVGAEAVGQDIYNNKSMVPENLGQEEKHDNVRLTSEHSRSEPENMPAEHIEVPLTSADAEFSPPEDNFDVQSTSESFAGQPPKLAPSSPEAVDSLHALVEQNDRVIDDDDLLRSNNTLYNTEKTMSSTSDLTEERATGSVLANLTEERVQPNSTSGESQPNLSAEPESITYMSDEGLSTSKNGKKDKKKEKSSFQRWEDEPAEQAIEEPLAEASARQDLIPRDVVDSSRPELEPMMTTEDDSSSLSKKSKKGKRNKKASTLVYTREPSPMPGITRELGTTPAYDSVEIAAEDSELPSRLTAKEQPTDTGEADMFDPPKGKKGKKKSKKSHTLDWADESANIAVPSEVDASTSAIDTVEALPTKSEALPDLTTEEQIVTTNDDDLLNLPKGKKSKKKSKQSRAPDWLDESAASPALIDPDNAIPLSTVEASSINRGEPHAMTAEEQPIITADVGDSFETPKGKKGKKKSKKLQAIDWDNMPTDEATPTDSTLGDDVTPLDILPTPQMSRIISQSPVDEPESESFSLKKDKKDKNKGTKGTDFAWNEEPAPESNQFGDDTAAKELSEIPLDRDVVQQEIEEANPRESNENETGEALDTSERSIGSPTKPPRNDADESTLTWSDKNIDQEVYPAFGLEEGLVQEPDPIRVSSPVGALEDIVEQTAVYEPRDGHTLHDINERQEDLQQEAARKSGNSQEAQSIGIDRDQGAFHEAAARFETREVLEHTTANQSAPQQGVSDEPESAPDSTYVKDREPPVRRQPFDIPPEPLPEPEKHRESEPEMADSPDIVEPQEDGLFLPFQTKKKGKKGKGSRQATPSNSETQEESAPLVDQGALFIPGDIGLDHKHDETQPGQFLEKTLKEAVDEENDPNVAGLSLSSEPEGRTDMLEPNKTEIPIADGDFSSFTMKKKNKKGKKSQRAADPLLEEPLIQTGDSLDQGVAQPVAEERKRNSVEISSHVPDRTADSFGVSTEDTPVTEDDFAGFATKKKGKKGKKAKQSEVSVHKEPDTEKQAQEPLLSEQYGEVFQGLPVSTVERADLSPPSFQNDSLQDDSFVGFGTKKKKGKKSKQSANLAFEEPASETAVTDPELMEEGREVVKGSANYKKGTNPDMLDSRTQNESAVDDEFWGFATKKGKKGKKGKQSSQTSYNTFEEPPTISEQLQVPITTTEEALPEVLEQSTTVDELPSVTEGVSMPLISTLSSQQEDGSSDLRMIERKPSKEGNEQSVILVDENTRYKTDESAQHQDDYTDDELTKRFGTTETPISYVKPDVNQPTYLEEDDQRVAISTDDSAFRQASDFSSRGLRVEESNVPEMEETPREQVFGEHGLQILPTPDTAQPSDTSNFEAASQGPLQGDVPIPDHLAKSHEGEDFAHPDPSNKEQTDNNFEIPTRKKSKKSKKGRGESSIAEESFPTSRPLSTTYQPAVAIEIAVNPIASLPEPLVKDTGRQNQMEQEGRAAATEEGSLVYTRSLQREPSIREDLLHRQTEESHQESAALNPDAEVVWDLPTTKKGKKGKKSKKQFLDLEPTSSTIDVRRDQRISDGERNLTELADGKMSSQNDSSTKDVLLSKSQDTKEHKIAQEYSASGELERTTELRESTKAVEPSVTATAVGAGIALFEDLARRESIAASKKEKKEKKRSDQYTDGKNETQRESALEQSSGLPDAAEYKESLDRSALSEGQNRALYSQYDAIRNRDSAIQIAESPIPGAKSPLHYSIRDSGYQGTDASPTLREVLALPRQNRFSHESISQEAEHDLSPVYDYDTNTNDQGHRAATHFHENSNSHNPLNISIEVDPAYDVSISRPVQEQEAGEETFQGRSRETEIELPASYSDRHEQHDLSNTASPIKHVDDRQPSPVDSTTRDRSSVLFQSSPSTREDNMHTEPLTELIRNPENTQHLDEIVRSPRTPEEPETSVAREMEGTKAPQASLFGGPIGVNSDSHTMISPPGTPDSSRRRQLDSMSDAGFDDSPLQEKSRRISDRGMPETSLGETQRSVALQRHSKQRVRSPLGDYAEDKEPVSTDKIISRLSWPTAEEENHSVDRLDRTKSRNSNPAQRSSSRHSPLPALAIDMAKQREPDFRSLSGASIRSGESISAYIRSPEIQSPATPPLRRVDRSVSGDLRAANKRGGANSLVKSTESELDTEPGFASSSTYDPVRDKGKERITKMTDVYVSRESHE
ncbi:hypothetical protein MMC26_007350 [Xylographa opegraphella]|nr:hypothetical protein [Xylographa opegraphella]